VTVVQPNEDGSYWRKIVRNKMIRMKEKRRLQAAELFAEEELAIDKDEIKGRVVSSWGPYTSIVGTAVKTGVAGLTAEAKLKAEADTLKLWQNEATWDQAGSQLAASFKAIDTDGSGTISRDELTLAIKHANPKMSDAEVAGMLASANLDESSEVSLSEFVMLMLFKQPVPA